MIFAVTAATVFAAKAARVKLERARAEAAEAERDELQELLETLKWELTVPGDIDIETDSKSFTEVIVTLPAGAAD